MPNLTHPGHDSQVENHWSTLYSSESLIVDISFSNVITSEGVLSCV